MPKQYTSAQLKRLALVQPELAKFLFDVQEIDAVKSINIPGVEHMQGGDRSIYY